MPPDTLSIRLSPEDRETLEQAAHVQGVKLGTFIKQTALAAARNGLRPGDRIVGAKGRALPERPERASEPMARPETAPRAPKYQKGPKPTLNDLWGR